MKTYITHVETHTKKIITGVFCDKCGVKISADDYRETRNFTLKVEQGMNYGSDGGETKIWEVQDLCNNCLIFLKQLLVAHGFNIVEREEEW